MLKTARLDLLPYTAELAYQVVVGRPRADYWAEDFPFSGDVAALGMFIRAGAPQGPWGPYMIIVRASGIAVGGAGFHGPPRPDGSVEIGYGLAESGRGNGYALESAQALVDLARMLGAARVVAGTTADNLPSQRILLALGMTATTPTDELRFALQL